MGQPSTGLDGTDFNYSPPRQRTDEDWGKTFPDMGYARVEFHRRRCSHRAYEIVEIEITAKQEGDKL
jgi:hypothetical protein